MNENRMIEAILKCFIKKNDLAFKKDVFKDIFLLAFMAMTVQL